MKPVNVSHASVVRVVERMLRRIAVLRGELELAEARLEQRVQALRDSQAAQMGAGRQRVHVLAGRLEAFCERHRAVLLQGGSKSIRTPAGVAGWRARPVSVEIIVGYTEQDVCALLEAAGRGRLVRVQRRPDRQAIRRACADGVLEAPALNAAGLALSTPEEEFYFQPDRACPAAFDRSER